MLFSTNYEVYPENIVQPVINIYPESIPLFPKRFALRAIFFSEAL